MIDSCISTSCSSEFSCFIFRRFWSGSVHMNAATGLIRPEMSQLLMVSSKCQPSCFHGRDGRVPLFLLLFLGPLMGAGPGGGIGGHLLIKFHRNQNKAGPPQTPSFISSSAGNWRRYLRRLGFIEDNDASPAAPLPHRGGSFYSARRIKIIKI